MKRGVLLPAAVVGIGAVALGLTCALRDRAVDLGPADSFLLDPRDDSIVVRRAGDEVVRVDLEGRPVATAPRLEPDAAIVLQGGQAYFFEPRTARFGAWPGPARELVVPSEAGDEVRLHAQGSRADGVLEDGTTALVSVWRGGELAELMQVDLAAGRITARGAPNVEGGHVRGVSRGPRGDAVALLVERAGEGRRHELRLLDARLAPAHVVDDVAPVLPSWLPDSGSLLFERRLGGISRFHPPEGKPAWLCDGSFPRVAQRNEICLRELQEPFVLIEKCDKEDILQIVRIFPFASGSDPRTVNITTGRVHKFGVAASADHTYIAFRQVEGALDESSGAERVVVMDQRAGYRSRVVGTRRAPCGADEIGPRFARASDAVFWIADGHLWKAPAGG